MHKWLLYTDIIRRIGPANVARFGLYKILLNVGWYKVSLPTSVREPGEFFACSDSVSVSHTEHRGQNDGAFDASRMTLFSRHDRQVGFPPEWMRDPLSEREWSGNDVHWSAIREFELPTGDVKTLWELSRFSHLFLLMQSWFSRERSDVARDLNRWFNSWNQHNPVNTGVNWKCAQETGIRLIHSLLVAVQVREHMQIGWTNKFREFVRDHCRRILATTSYARAQDNNHGISEAVALILGGVFLAVEGGGNVAKITELDAWKANGISLLCERLSRLIARDGSFSQHSVIYHRMVVDLLCIAEWWRRTYGEDRYPEEFYEKAAKATDWLASVVDKTSGDAPNLGHNDGGRLIPLADHDYRDFRPTLQFAGAIFTGFRYFDDRSNGLLKIFNVQSPEREYQYRRFAILDGSYACIRPAPRILALMLIPDYQFRPAHADGLHLDLWVNGINLLRDSGTYSYARQQESSMLASTQSHNTIEFDGDDQMPRFGRFLFANWLHAAVTNVDESKASVEGRYTDWKGREHRREVHVDERVCTVNDLIDGAWKTAVLRWRVPTDDWTVAKNQVTGSQAEFRFTADRDPLEISVNRHFESRYYLECSEVDVIEVAIAPGTSHISTEICFAGSDS